jgi:hypothetical protein
VVSDVTGREQLDIARRHVIPDLTSGDIYAELYEKYPSLYPATLEQVHRLAVLQEQGTV